MSFFVWDLLQIKKDIRIENMGKALEPLARGFFLGFYSLRSFFVGLRIGVRTRRVESHSRLVSSYRTSTTMDAPQRLSHRAFFLFYRPRTLWVAFQVLVFSGLALWTIKNYLVVLKSL
jgi:hypothetical protein